MTNPITQYFTFQLAQKNYPTDDIRYSLNYCQGDGMAFYGVIEDDDSKALTNRLLTGTEKAAAKRAIEKGAIIRITRNSYATHYSHFNTMTVDAEDPYSIDLTEFESSALQRLVECIATDVVTTSKELEADGYRISQAGSRVWSFEDNIRVFRTNRFEVKFEEVEDEFFSLEYMDDQQRQELLAGFVNKTYRHFLLRVSVTGIDSGIELASRSVGDVVWRNDTPTFHYDGLARTLLAEVVQEARAVSRSVSLAA